MATVTVTNVEQQDPLRAAQISPVSATAVKLNASWQVVVFSMLSVAVAAVLMWLAYAYWIQPKPILIKSGYVPFAGLIVVTAGLERLLEPVSQVIMPKDTPHPGDLTGRSAAQHAAMAKSMAQEAAANPHVGTMEVQSVVHGAARAQAWADTRRSERAIIFWAIASVCGLGISGGFGFLLLQSVASNHVNSVLDLVVTGLAIGAGTKPLHDLITSIQSKAAS